MTLLLFLACASPNEMDRAKWQSLSHDDRVLFVKTLIGAEQSKNAKGGGGLNYNEDAAVYAQRIDDAYARGDQRRVDEIFAEMGTK
ncbi:MAG TPA: hypothetical protein VFN10_09540 [Thermoanaerobaculia bacterium]|nr:hypothetical protein [Thermoanaerobaculia bacterium]